MNKNTWISKSSKTSNTWINPTQQEEEKLKPGSWYLETPLPSTKNQKANLPSQISNRDSSAIANQSQNGDKPVQVMLRPQSHRLLHDPLGCRHNFPLLLRRRCGDLGPGAAQRRAPLFSSLLHHHSLPLSGNSQLLQPLMLQVLFFNIWVFGKLENVINPLFFFLAKSLLFLLIWVLFSLWWVCVNFTISLGLKS